jgi:menaquinone-dependent protoporphyrinogen IX oxidase
MARIAVIYKSQYGTTKQYAEWIAEVLEAKLFEASDIKPVQLMAFDVVVYGGGLYAGEVIGAKLVTKNPCKSLVLFTVGLADPKITDYSEIVGKTLSREQLAKAKVFHLRGGVDYSKLGFVHKRLLAMVKKAAEKKPLNERTGDDHGLIETYGKKIDFTDKATIEPLIAYVRAL